MLISIFVKSYRRGCSKDNRTAAVVVMSWRVLLLGQGLDVPSIAPPSKSHQSPIRIDWNTTNAGLHFHAACSASSSLAHLLSMPDNSVEGAAARG
jgi:hypothetical protein